MRVSFFNSVPARLAGLILLLSGGTLLFRGRRKEGMTMKKVNQGEGDVSLLSFGSIMDF